MSNIFPREHARFITVPKNREAVELLNRNSHSPSDVDEIVLSEQDYGLLLNSGIFDELFRFFGIPIVDYEDQEIVDIEVLHKIKEYLGKKSDLESNSELAQILEGIRTLFCKAIEWRTGVYFFF